MLNIQLLIKIKFKMTRTPNALFPQVTQFAMR